MTNDLWVSQFEPKKLDDVIGQTELVQLFKKYAKDKFIPNLTLAGSPGIGKTLLVKLFAVELRFIKYENNEIQHLLPGQFYLLNASESRGIDDVRGTLKRLSSKPTIDDIPRLICLDEFNFTNDAQFAMRSLMQEYSSNTRFIIISNDPSNIIEPIISRCPLKIVQPPTLNDAKIIIERIQKEKQFQISLEAINELYKITQGDLRSLIGKIQDLCLVSNFNIQIQHIQNTDIPLDTAKAILEVAQINFEQAKETLLTIYTKNRDAKNLLEKLYSATYITKFSEDIEANKIIAMRLRDRMTDVDDRLTHTTNHLLQLDGLLNYVRLLKYIPLTCPKAK